jgi:hypothetical protein
MRDRHLPGEVFGREGKAVLLLLGFLIVFGWFLVAPESQIPKLNQIIFLLLPIVFLSIVHFYPRWLR